MDLDNDSRLGVDEFIKAEKTLEKFGISYGGD